MADLIDREAAIKEVEEWAEHGYDLIHWTGIKAMLETQPAVDAAPVRHGRWIRVSGYVTPGGDPVWKCSECGKGVHVYGIEASSYQKDVSDQQWVSCPNCGAKMEEELWT